MSNGLVSEQLAHNTRQWRQDAIKETRPTFYTQLLVSYKASSKYEKAAPSPKVF